MNFLDYVGVTGLASIVVEFRSLDVVLLLSHCKAALREMILESGVVDSIPPNSIFISNHDAVLYCLNESLSGERMPLLLPAVTTPPMTMTTTRIGMADVDLNDDDDEAGNFLSIVDVNDIYVVDPEKMNGSAGKAASIGNGGESTNL